MIRSMSSALSGLRNHQVMLDVVAAEPGLHNPHGGPAPRPDHRPLTKFEKRGLDLGHEIVDIVAVRRGPGAQ